MAVARLAEFFLFTDWARNKLHGLAAERSDAELDRAFEMGPGSLRETVRHCFAAERVWHERCAGSPLTDVPDPAETRSIGDIDSAARKLSEARTTWLAGPTAGALNGKVAFTRKGESHTHRLGDILLHVCNHGMHHRAQAVNMLRRLGVKPPWLDYIAMPIERGETRRPCVGLEPLRRLFAYGDWANRRLLDTMQRLDDSAPDRPFEIGMGTLRKTLGHIRDAEQWWLTNWTRGPGAAFPPADDRISLCDLRSQFAVTIAARDAFLGNLSDADLDRMVSAVPRPGVTREFTLGMTLTQLVFHGTHHRAQAVNMLRHVGAGPVQHDFIAFALQA